MEAPEQGPDSAVGPEIDEAMVTRLLMQELGRLDAWLIEHRRTNLALDGSRHAADDEAAAPFYVSHEAHQALSHALDHLRTLRAVLVKAQELPMAAGFTLLRGTLENAATAVWLLQPDDRAERVLRRLLLAKTDLRDTEAMARLGFSYSGPSSADLLAEINKIGIGAGVDPAKLAGRPPGQARIVAEAGAATSRGPKRVEATWRLCSGFSHARSWSMTAALDRQDVAEIAPGVYDVQMRAPLRSVAAVAQTAVEMLDVGLRMHVRHRNRL